MSPHPCDSAFPSPATPGYEDEELGMTLRTYIATAAMQGWIAGLGEEATESYEGEPEAFAEHQRAVARTAVGYADALIEELNREADTDAAVCRAESRMERGPNE